MQLCSPPLERLASRPAAWPPPGGRCLTGVASPPPARPLAHASASAQIANAAVFLAVFLLFVGYWLWTVYRTLQDHKKLPWAKYR